MEERLLFVLQEGLEIHLAESLDTLLIKNHIIC